MAGKMIDRGDPKLVREIQEIDVAILELETVLYWHGMER